MDICRQEEPPFKDYGDGHYAACLRFTIDIVMAFGSISIGRLMAPKRKLKIFLGKSG
jgi:hypothetical protein